MESVCSSGLLTASSSHSDNILLAGKMREIVSPVLTERYRSWDLTPSTRVGDLLAPKTSEDVMCEKKGTHSKSEGRKFVSVGAELLLAWAREWEEKARRWTASA